MTYRPEELPEVRRLLIEACRSKSQRMTRQSWILAYRHLATAIERGDIQINIKPSIRHLKYLGEDVVT
jgi:hypothetical protein